MNNSQNFDPKLKACMKEIRRVMDKYDAGGFIVLASPSHSEFGMELPKWAGFRWVDKNAGKIHIRMHAESNPVEAGNTVHFAVHLRDLCGIGFSYGDSLAKMIDQTHGIEYTGDSTFTPHVED